MSKLKTKDIRKHHKHTKAPCHICGMHETVTEWHHAVPLEHIAKNIDYYASKNIFPPKGFINTLFCLCPSCHGYVHKYHRENDYLPVEFFREFKKYHTEDAADKFLEVVNVYVHEKSMLEQWRYVNDDPEIKSYFPNHVEI